MKRTPRSRKTATFSCVAGLSHISVCIAGATKIGHVAASTAFVSMLSAIPARIFARVLAVAGTTTIASASRASLTWATSSASSQTSE